MQLHPRFGFAPSVWHDATKIVTMNSPNITSLCRSKCLRIRNLLALMMHVEMFTFESFLNRWGPTRDGQPRRPRWLWNIAPPFLGGWLEPPLLSLNLQALLGLYVRIHVHVFIGLRTTVVQNTPTENSLKHRKVLIIFALMPQTIITKQMLSREGYAVNGF